MILQRLTVSTRKAASIYKYMNLVNEL